VLKSKPMREMPCGQLEQLLIRVLELLLGLLGMSYSTCYEKLLRLV
jgi:hypothetical protein